MRFDDIERISGEVEEALVKAGVSRPAARDAVADMQLAAIRDLVETQGDRRLLNLFDQCGAEVLAERQRVSVRTIYARRQDALNRLAVKQTVRNIAESIAEKAA